MVLESSTAKKEKWGNIMKMKAALLEGPGKLAVREIEKPSCPEGGMLLKVKSVGICGSDMRKFAFGSSAFTYPVVLGHEVAGEVAEVAEGVTDYKVGDRLVVGAIIPCGKCHNCLNGKDNLCQNPVYQSMGVFPDHPGGYAEYMPLPADMLERGPLVRIPDGVSYDVAALTEPFTTVLNSHEPLKTPKNGTVLIIGAGPIGCMHVELFKADGLKTVIADVVSDRLKIAKEACGADYTINSKEQDLEAEIKKLTDGRGADIVVVACSVRVMQEQAIKYVSPGGDIILFGGLPDQDHMVQFDSNVLHYSQIRLHGTIAQCKRHYQKVMDILASGKVKTENYITVLPLDEINEGVKLTREGKALKVILHP